MKILLLLLLVGCATSTPYGEFQSIGSDYIVDKHDCDDMAQEWADWLEEYGVRRSSMRFVSLPPHFWMEVQFEDGWRMYDVASGFYGRPSETLADASYIPAHLVYRDMSGYQQRGDRWIDGRWIGD